MRQSHAIQPTLCEDCAITVICSPSILYRSELRIDTFIAPHLFSTMPPIVTNLRVRPGLLHVVSPPLQHFASYRPLSFRPLLLGSELDSPAFFAYSDIERPDVGANALLFSALPSKVSSPMKPPRKQLLMVDECVERSASVCGRTMSLTGTNGTRSTSRQSGTRVSCKDVPRLLCGVSNHQVMQ